MKDKNYKVIVRIDERTHSLVGVYTSFRYAARKAKEYASRGNTLTITDMVTGNVTVIMPL